MALPRTLYLICFDFFNWFLYILVQMNKFYWMYSTRNFEHITKCCHLEYFQQSWRSPINAEHLLSIPSLGGPTHPKPSLLGLGHVLVKARSSVKLPSHRPEVCMFWVFGLEFSCELACHCRMLWYPSWLSVSHEDTWLEPKIYNLDSSKQCMYFHWSNFLCFSSSCCFSSVVVSL